MINNKMTAEIMNTGEYQTDHVVEEMKEALQQEIAMEERNRLEEQQKVEYQKYKAEDDKFLDELKGLWVIGWGIILCRMGVEYWGILLLGRLIINYEQNRVAAAPSNSPSYLRGGGLPDRLGPARNAALFTNLGY